jgi:hypothetical protein
MMSGHDCCAPVGREEEESGDGPAVRAESNGRGRTMQCPLGRRHASEPAGKVRFDAAPPSSTFSTQPPAPRSSHAAHTSAACPLTRDRGGTYLRCCAFLI